MDKKLGRRASCQSVSLVFAVAAMVAANGSAQTVRPAPPHQARPATAPATLPDPAHYAGGEFVHGVYDEKRQLLFATNVGLNEVDVFSGADMSLKARIPVPAPIGIDLMADGKTLVVGTATQSIALVDEDTHAVTVHSFGEMVLDAALAFPTVVAMANGSILAIGQEMGVYSPDIVNGGQTVWEWTPTGNIMRQLEPDSSVQIHFETLRLARSGDHKWAVFSADYLYLYSSDSDSLTQNSYSVVLPNRMGGASEYALNQDGSRIALCVAENLYFLDRSLRLLGTATIPVDELQLAVLSSAEFSPDGKRLYLQYAMPPALLTVDAAAYKVSGFYGAAIDNYAPDYLQGLLALDARGTAFFGNAGFVSTVDLTRSPAPLSSPRPNCSVAIRAVLPLNESATVQLSMPIQGETVYAGGRLAAVGSGGATVTIPAGTKAGPTDVECVDASGNGSILTNQVSYGMEIAGFSANLLPPAGNTHAYLFGYGLRPDGSSTAPTVTVGGQVAADVSNIYFRNLGVLQGASLSIPPGVPGQKVSVHVSSQMGAGTLAGAATYYGSPRIIKNSGAQGILYDDKRDRLYVLKPTEIDVLVCKTMLWLRPMAIPKEVVFTGGQPMSMALTPDRTSLVVMIGITGDNQQIENFVVFDLSSASGVAYLAGAANYGYQGAMTITKGNIVVIPGLWSLTFDLNTHQISIWSKVQLGTLVKTSADGSRLYSVMTDSSGGWVFTVDVSGDPSTWVSRWSSFGYTFWTELAVAPDGSQLAAVNQGFPLTAGTSIGFFNSMLELTGTNVYPDFAPPDDVGIVGATFSPSGKVLVVPARDAIELWDANTGTLRGRLMTPEELGPVPNTWTSDTPLMALNKAADTIYAVSRTGITIIPLGSPIDSMPAYPWPAGRRATHPAPPLVTEEAEQPIN
jgi:hypothetical protein